MVKNLKRLRKKVEKENGKAEAQKWILVLVQIRISFLQLCLCICRVDFYPTTFELPVSIHCVFYRNSATNALNLFNFVCTLQSEYHMFLEEFKKNPGVIWIMKPVAKSQGKGIFLFRRLKDIEAWKKVSALFNFAKNFILNPCHKRMEFCFKATLQIKSVPFLEPFTNMEFLLVNFISWVNEIAKCKSVWEVTHASGA